jgi:hypothetical protein
MLAGFPIPDAIFEEDPRGNPTTFAMSPRDAYGLAVRGTSQDAEPREVKDMSQGRGALAHHKAKSTGLSGFPVCASAFPHIMPEAS